MTENNLKCPYCGQEYPHATNTEMVACMNIECPKRYRPIEKDVVAALILGKQARAALDVAVERLKQLAGGYYSDYPGAAAQETLDDIESIIKKDKE